MIRISKNSNNINSIKIWTKQEMDLDYDGGKIDSFVIIPGVTQYKHIYTSNQYLIFDSIDNYISVEFSSTGDLERFFLKFERDIKLNQVLDLKIDKVK
jgi:hypothetical protein